MWASEKEGRKEGHAFDTLFDFMDEWRYNSLINVNSAFVSPLIFNDPWPFMTL